MRNFAAVAIANHPSQRLIQKAALPQAS